MPVQYTLGFTALLGCLPVIANAATLLVRQIRQTPSLCVLTDTLKNEGVF
jgi:hypothetical protein